MISYRSFQILTVIRLVALEKISKKCAHTRYPAGCSKPAILEGCIHPFIPEEELGNTSRFLKVKNGGHVKFCARLKRIGDIELVPDRLKEFNELYGVPKDKIIQRGIPNSRWANFHSFLQDDYVLPNLGYMQHQAFDGKKIHLWEN